MNNPPKVSTGDRVRIVLEGEAASIVKNGRIEIGKNCEANLIFPDAAHVVSIEVLEPEWQVGDVVRTRGGLVFLRGADEDDPWLDLMTLRGHRESWPTRPLTLLVRDGKPV